MKILNTEIADFEFRTHENHCTQMRSQMLCHVCADICEYHGDLMYIYPTNLRQQ